MAKSNQLREQMQSSPKADWSIEQLKTVAKHYGIVWRQPGTSHVTFVTPKSDALTIPAQKPIKPVYIRQFLKVLARLENDDGNFPTSQL